MEQVVHLKNFDYYFPLERFSRATNADKSEGKLLHGPDQIVLFERVPQGAFQKGGGSGRFSFEFKEAGTFEYVIKPHEKDLSQGLAITFLFRSDDLKPEDISLRIADAEKEQFLSVALVRPLSDYWSRLYFKMDKLVDVDRNQIEEVAIVFQGEKARRGFFSLDEVIVVGERDFIAASREDNIDFFKIPLEMVKAKSLLAKTDEELLEDIAKKTWAFFEATTDRQTQLPVDRVNVSGKRRLNTFTSPTNIGLYLAAIIGAEKMGYLSEGEMESRLTKVLDVLERMQRWQGFYFNFYDTRTLESVHPFISTIDNGWLAIGLITARERVQGSVRERIQKLLDLFDFRYFYREENGHLVLGFDTKANRYSDFDYGLLCTEARATSFVAIGLGHIELAHWFRMFRGFPPDRDWQNGRVYGREKFYLGQKVFSGFYIFRNIQIVPSWGGSLFEFLMPTLFLKEKELGQKALGENNRRAVQAQAEYAAKKKYSVWGFSPCAIWNGNGEGYGEFGLSMIGAKGYPDSGMVTPHVSFLALDPAPDVAIQNIRGFLTHYPKLITNLGFFDSVNIRTNTVVPSFLCLDQEMIFLSVCNYLNQNYLKELFNKSAEAQRAVKVLQVEEFY